MATVALTVTGAARAAVIAEIDLRRAGTEGEAAHDRAVAEVRRQQEADD